MPAPVQCQQTKTRTPPLAYYIKMLERMPNAIHIDGSSKTSTDLLQTVILLRIARTTAAGSARREGADPNWTVRSGVLPATSAPTFPLCYHAESKQTASAPNNDTPERRRNDERRRTAANGGAALHQVRRALHWHEALTSRTSPPHTPGSWQFHFKKKMFTNMVMWADLTNQRHVNLYASSAFAHKYTYT